MGLPPDPPERNFDRLPAAVATAGDVGITVSFKLEHGH